MNKALTRLAGIALLLVLAISCKKNINSTAATVAPATTYTTFSTSSTITENFETGSKTAYADANVTLTTGSWDMNDALIGTSASDAKTGSQSARVRNTGIISMNFDVSGATTVSVDHAEYGSDGSSTWELLESTNSGSTYTQVGSTITTSSTTLQTVSFTVNVTGNVRFRIAKLTGSTNRINIDNIVISTGTNTVISVPDNDHMLLGNPNNAAITTDSLNNYLMIKPYYDLSYNSTRGEPNWVSWHLYTGDLGSTDRLDNFRADSSLPVSWFWVGGNDYSGSGFDRGHNCPSGDRTLSTTTNSATFLMSNMIPQAPYNNEQTWANMEDSIRVYVKAGNEAFIVMGSYGTGGTGANGFATTIDGGHVTVPANIWKVVVLIPNGNGDLSRIDTTVRVIAVIVPNNNSVSSTWKSYRTTVDAIEAATGYNLLSNVPVAVQNVLEARVDTK